MVNAFCGTVLNCWKFKFKNSEQKQVAQLRTLMVASNSLFVRGRGKFLRFSESPNFVEVDSGWMVANMA